MRRSRSRDRARCRACSADDLVSVEQLDVATRSLVEVRRGDDDQLDLIQRADTSEHVGELVAPSGGQKWLRQGLRVEVEDGGHGDSRSGGGRRPRHSTTRSPPQVDRTPTSWSAGVPIAQEGVHLGCLDSLYSPGFTYLDKAFPSPQGSPGCVLRFLSIPEDAVPTMITT